MGHHAEATSHINTNNDLARKEFEALISSRTNSDTDQEEESSGSALFETSFEEQTNIDGKISSKMDTDNGSSKEKEIGTIGSLSDRNNHHKNSHNSHKNNSKLGLKIRQQSHHGPVSSSAAAVTGENENVNTKATGMTRRCHCNLSQCASTNYMCKSEKRIETSPDGTTIETDAGCFVEELNILGNSKSQFGPSGGVTEANGRVTSARRGCIEMLSREKLKLCSDRTGSPVHCCFNDDMCNYPKTFYPPQFHTPTRNRANYDSINGVRGMPPPNLDQQVWLRAALICVPICGLMILIVLIFVARRLLKPDYQRNKLYSNYYYPPPPPSLPPPNEYPYMKSVYLPENQEEHLWPVENAQQQQQQQCRCCDCCHNNNSQLRDVDDNSSLTPTSSIASASPRSNGIGTRKISTETTISETEELVTSSITNCQEPIICQCSSDDINGHSAGVCNIRPPSIVFTGPPIPSTSSSSSAAKMFNNVLLKLGIFKNGENSRLSNV